MSDSFLPLHLRTSTFQLLDIPHLKRKSLYTPKTNHRSVHTNQSAFQSSYEKAREIYKPTKKYPFGKQNLQGTHCINQAKNSGHSTPRANTLTGFELSRPHSSNAQANTSFHFQSEQFEKMFMRTGFQYQNSSFNQGNSRTMQSLPLLKSSRNSSLSRMSPKYNQAISQSMDLTLPKSILKKSKYGTAKSLHFNDDYEDQTEGAMKRVRFVE